MVLIMTSYLPLSINNQKIILDVKLVKYMFDLQDAVIRIGVQLYQYLDQLLHFKSRHSNIIYLFIHLFIY